MHPLREYDIEFIKLQPGDHEFNYTIDSGFFKLYEQSQVSDGNVNVDITFTKGSNVFDLFFVIFGEVEVECDRCLDNFRLPVEGNFNLMVKITEREAEDEDDIIYLSPHEHKINVAQFIYDTVMLAIPIKKTCDMAGKICNPAATEKITGSIDVSIENEESGEEDSKEEINPEWEKQLKNIFKN
ncbi:MAG: DUF177 domain-containing protein [Bacteroidia bacterium]|nr:DUF177 domain-containing protein [Bacteroidia bacterium]